MGMAPAGGRLPFRVRTTRMFPTCPTQQSVVDQVVFGRDMDNSGEEKFDGGYVSMFSNCAGIPSWESVAEDAALMRFSMASDAGTESSPRRMGRTLITDAPGQRSLVDQVVFNRDLDNSGDTAFVGGFL